VPTINVQFQVVAPPGQAAPQPLLTPAIFLANTGPRVPIAITLHASILQQLTLQGTPSSTVVTGSALIDTGAGITCIDIDAATQLGAPIIDYVNMTSASHAGNVQPVYPVQLQIPGSPINISAPRAVGFPLAASQGIIALIGRDVLQSCVLVYNGTAGSISLSV
jgi:predicted aspartyl protease